MRVAVLRVAAVLALFAAVCGCRAEVIDDILSSLSRGVTFLERQHEHINLDGVVGFVMLQGRTVYQLQEHIWKTAAVCYLRWTRDAFQHFREKPADFRGS